MRTLALICTQIFGFWAAYVCAEEKTTFVKAVERDNPGCGLAVWVNCAQREVVSPAIVRGSLCLQEEFLELNHGLTLNGMGFEEISVPFCAKHLLVS